MSGFISGIHAPLGPHGLQPDDTVSLLGCCIFRWYANRQGQENIEGEPTSYCRRNSRSPQGFDPRPIIELEKYQTLCSR